MTARTQVREAARKEARPARVQKVWVVTKGAKAQQVAALAGTMPLEEIAERMHLSPDSIRRYAVLYGISLAYKRKPVKPEERALIMQAHQDGQTIRQIADRTGRTPDQVRAIIHYTNKRGIKWTL